MPGRLDLAYRQRVLSLKNNFIYRGKRQGKSALPLSFAFKAHQKSEKKKQKVNVLDNIPKDEKSEKQRRQTAFLGIWLVQGKKRFMQNQQKRGVKNGFFDKLVSRSCFLGLYRV